MLSLISILINYFFYFIQYVRFFFNNYLIAIQREDSEGENLRFLIQASPRASYPRISVQIRGLRRPKDGRSMTTSRDRNVCFSRNTISTYVRESR